MNGGTAALRPLGGLLRTLVALIGLHSCGLGLVILLAPRAFSDWMGFAETATFFPSQSGAFLLSLGVCYLLALRHRVLIAVIVVSKAVAVPFLVVHAAFLGAPPMVWAAAAGDACMLTAVLLLLGRGRTAGGEV